MYVASEICDWLDVRAVTSESLLLAFVYLLPIFFLAPFALLEDRIGKWKVEKEMNKKLGVR